MGCSMGRKGSNRENLMNFAQLFGRTISLARLCHDKSQNELAVQTGLSREVIAKIETGRSIHIPALKAFILMDALELSPRAVWNRIRSQMAGKTGRH